jgi:hypothetical protein
MCLSPEETAHLILTLFRQHQREARFVGPLLGIDPDIPEPVLIPVSKRCAALSWSPGAASSLPTTSRRFTTLPVSKSSARTFYWLFGS